MKKLTLTTLLLLTLTSVTLAGTWAQINSISKDTVSITVGYDNGEEMDWRTFGWPDTITIDVMLTVIQFGADESKPDYKDNYERTITLSRGERANISIEWNWKSNGQAFFYLEVEYGEGDIEVKDLGV